MLTLDLQINWFFCVQWEKFLTKKTSENWVCPRWRWFALAFLTLGWPLLWWGAHTYVKLFIESWKSPLLNFPREFRVKRAKKFVKPALHGGVVWVVQHYTYIVLSNLLRHIYQSTWGLFNINSLQDIRVCMYLYVYFCI